MAGWSNDQKLAAIITPAAKPSIRLRAFGFGVLKKTTPWQHPKLSQTMFQVLQVMPSSQSHSSRIPPTCQYIKIGGWRLLASLVRFIVVKGFFGPVPILIWLSKPALYSRWLSCNARFNLTLFAFCLSYVTFSSGCRNLSIDFF